MVETLQPSTFGRVEIAAEDVGSGAALRSETVDIDVYPEVVHVRAHFEIEAGPGIHGSLRVGFPEAIPQQGLAPFEALVVRVDGAPVAVGREAAWINASDLRHERAGTTIDPDDRFAHNVRIKSWGRSIWRTWELELEPGRVAAVDVEYVQMLKLSKAGDEQLEATVG